MEEKRSVCCVGSAGVGAVVGFSWLLAAVNGQTGGDDAARFLFNEEYRIGFNVSASDELERLVSGEMFVKFLFNAG